jgi:hypothetical protein
MFLWARKWALTPVFCASTWPPKHSVLKLSITLQRPPCHSAAVSPPLLELLFPGQVVWDFCVGKLGTGNRFPPTASVSPGYSHSAKFSTFINCPMVEALCYKPEGRGFESLCKKVKLSLTALTTMLRDPMRWMNVSIYLIHPASLGPRLYSASNRNEYQKQTNNVSGE